MDFEQARYNMVEQQIRPWDVPDSRILDIIKSTPREAFVPHHYEQLAFSDTNIPIGHDQVMLTPREEARFLQILNIQPNDKVLEVGTGSGYFTALLAKLANHVYSIDIQKDFTEQAGSKLTELGIKNVTLQTGNAVSGWNDNLPFNVIVITGGLYKLPKAFLQSLDDNGKLLAIIGDEPAQTAVLFTKNGNSVNETPLFEMSVPRLIDAKEPERFKF